MGEQIIREEDIPEVGEEWFKKAHLKIGDLDLTAIKERYEKATPEPWWPGHLSNDNHSCDCDYVLSEHYMGAVARICVGNDKPISEGGNDSPPLEEAKANLRFIAHARADVPKLLNALTASLARVIELEQDAKRWEESRNLFAQETINLKAERKVLEAVAAAAKNAVRDDREFDANGECLSGRVWALASNNVTTPLGDALRELANTKEF